MSTFAAFVAGRKTKWLVLVVWIIVAVVLGGIGSGLSDKTNDQTQSFLPKSAESTKVVNLLDDKFPGGQTSSGLIIYKRDGGLTPADQAIIESDARKIASDRNVVLVSKPVTPDITQRGTENVSKDGSVALTYLTLPDDQRKAGDWGKEVDRILGADDRAGLKTYLSGDLGFNTDANKVFGSLDGKLLGATVFLVLFLLGLIYRAVLVALSPLIVVMLAYLTATGLIYAYAESGAEVSTNATSILIVLMFGVGTDYCLLLVSRYREELRAHEDKHEAMQVALSRTAPAIIASGMTVAIAMLVLLVAETGSIHSLGPGSAIGIFCAMVAGVTLLPALLTIFGRVGFWPRRGVVVFDPEHAREINPGIWRRVGDRVLRHPGPALAITVAVFGAGALGLLAYKENFSTTGFFKKPTESVDGFKVLQSAFPAGSLSPMTVLVQSESGGTVDPQAVQQVAAKVGAVPNVAHVTESQQQSKDGSIANLTVVLGSDPNGSKALNTVPKIRDAVHDAVPGVRALVGGGTGIYYDFDRATNRDTKLIVPLGLLVVTLILGILLQAIVAPLVLILTVIASFFGTFGMAMVFIRYIVGDPGVDSSLPSFAFIFLVSLGCDYTIFLMSRVREEARHYGTREGTLRALAATGPVITSAGVILAGTFSVLMTLPVTFTFNLGFLVAAGILLDTFIVRTIMVPAAVELLGDRIWWPSTAQGGGRALREHSDEHPTLPPQPVGARE